jgi:5-methylcytosine-specific restriction endonuclease McrA
VTFKNAQIDHKTPVTGLRNLPIRFHLDRIENLQAICRRCNCAKGEMSDEKYRKLLAFIRSDRDIYRAVWRRLSMSGYGWKSVKKKAASAGSS